MDKRKILLISNGHGEDIIAANILRELLKREQDISVSVLPVVGHGDAYKSLPIELIGPRKKLPSGGFARNSISNLIKDIKAGLLSLTLSQISTIKKAGKDIDSVIVVGDVFILLLAGLFIKKKIFFLPTAKSEYISGHYWIEKKLIKKYADFVFPRDEKTTTVLEKFGINAFFLGNAMMDCFEIKGADFELDENKATIGILPGSREEAYDNLLQILKVVDEIERYGKSYNYITAISSNLLVENIIGIIKGTKWTYKIPEKKEKLQGIYLLLLSPGGKSTLKIIYHHFGDVLNQSDIFIGLAGTANEQAVGMGKPLVAFPGTGTQYTLSFARAQKLLLGNSMKLLSNSSKEIAGTVIDIIENKEKYKSMGNEGKNRMGRPGAVKRMADIIIKNL